MVHRSSVLALLVLVALCSAEDITSADVQSSTNQFISPAHKLDQPNPYLKNEESKEQMIGNAPILAPIPVLAQPANQLPAANRQGRFFFPFNNFANGLTGNPSLSSVLTLNLNNLAFVGLFLIGVFILLPSVIGFVTGLTGAGAGAPFAGKSLRTDDKPSYMWNMMQILDNVLAKYNIDARVCMERATCHVAKNTLSSRSGASSPLETALNFAITSSYGQRLLDSYSLKDAVDKGRNANGVADCDAHYSKCPYSLGNLSKLLSTFSTFGGGSSAPSPNPYHMFNSTFSG